MYAFWSRVRQPLDGRALGCLHCRSISSSVVKNYDKFDAATKTAILKASSSVACVISRIGDRLFFIGSGIVIECDAHDGSFLGTILTCANLLRGPAGAASLPPNLKIDIYLSDGNIYEGQGLLFDFHYNIATIKIKSSTPLPTAKIRLLDDTISLNSTKCSSLPKDEEAASTRFNLIPGEVVIALARSCKEPHEVIVAPGLFSCDDGFRDCKELFSTTCIIDKDAVGGPVVNCYGEVIGMNIAICECNAFLPMNIASKCLEELRSNRKIPRPWLGLVVANLYTADLKKLKELTLNFPHVTKGVIVEQIIKNRKTYVTMKRKKVFHWSLWPHRKWLKEKVIPKNIRKMKRTKWVKKIELKQESPASVAGLCVGDIIIKCDQYVIGSHLEFIEALWNKEGKTVELVVVRPRIGQLNVIVTIGANPKMNRWQVPLSVYEILEDQLAIERREKGCI